MRAPLPLTRTLVLTLCLAAGGVPGAAAPGPPAAMPPGRLAFQSYGATQGLGNLSVWCLEQDGQGFLWVGTEDGLFRYDAHRFTNLAQEEGLPSPWIRTLRAQGTDRLWIGTTRGLALRERGRLRRLGAAEGMPDVEIFALELDGEGRLWVATEHGLFRQRKGALAFDPAPGWPARALARALWVDRDQVYVTSQARLLRYSLASPGAPQDVRGPWKERLDAVVVDGGQRLWVRSRSGLWMRSGEEAPFADLSGRLGPATYDGSLKLTPAGELLIPTVDGLARIKGEAWEHVGRTQGLPTPWVNRALVDREGCLWVGGLGLHRSLARESWLQHTERDGISGGVVRAILKDRQGRMWVGTTNGLCEAREGRWQALPQTLNQAFLALVQAQDGAIWMGGAPGRLRRWVPGTSQWKEFPEPQSTITSLAFDPQGVLWVATRRQGLYRVLRQGGGYRVEPFTPPGSGPEERIQELAPGPEGRVWMTGAQGLLLLEGGRWTRFGRAEGLRSGAVSAVLERAGGEIWVAYQDVQGLSRCVREGGRMRVLEHLDAARGFKARKAYFIREDALGRLWIGTAQGVDLMESGAFRHFSVSEGLPGDDCNGSAFLAEPGGDVWVGTLGGLARFRQDRAQDVPMPPASFILAAQYGSRELQAPLPQGLRIPRREASIEFRFTGLSYLNENRVQHQVRLVGLENAWRDTDIRQARYTNLGPGNYRFEVRAGLGDGRWGPVASAAFVVLPAWWQTWWFRGLAAFGFLGLAALVIRARLAVLRRRNRELEALVHERTRALEQANETLKQLTVTDPLTGLKNRRFLDLTIADDLSKVHRDYQSIQRGQAGRMATNVDIVFLMVDLDHFKHVNDTYGHAAGDAVLRQVKDRLLEAVRDSDTVVRWGGEEFLVVARRTDRSQGDRIAARILELVRNRPFDLGQGQTLVRTCSLGFCPYPLAMEDPEAVDWQQVVELADRCLYAAKLSGRNGYVGIRGECSDLAEVKSFLEDPASVSPGEMSLQTSFPDVRKLTWK